MKIFEAVLNLLIRIMVGCIVIYACNLVLEYLGYGNYIVGFNQVTIGTVGLLGVPGVALLYGMVWIL